MPDAASQPSVPGELFISYASPDVARAEALHKRLVAEKFSVWFDKAWLNAGCDWHNKIEAGCDGARVVLPLLTPAWQRSEWTKYETYAARTVLPIIAEGAPEDVLTPPLRRWQAHRFDPLTADETAWQALFASIRGAIAGPMVERSPFLLRLPHEANRYFTGREAEMNRLHEALHPGPVPTPTEARAWAITGLGGIGKTTLANEYVRRFRRLYPQIIWVDTRPGYQAQFAAAFDQMFPNLALQDIPDAKKAARVRDVLREPDDRLLVLDNVVDEASAAEWIPHEGGCRTLITSRVREFSLAVRTIELPELSPDSARGFLLRRTGRSGCDRDSAACDKLAERLGHLPLALEQAAAYMAEQRMDFSKYLGLFEDAAAELLAKHALGSTHYPDPVITTWRVTVADLSPEARAVLRLSAAMGSAPIALDVLIDGAPQVAMLGATLPELRRRWSWFPWGGRRETGPARAPPAPDRAKAELAVRDAVGAGLHRYSMIQDWNGDSFRVHPLVRDVEWFAMDNGERRYACGLVARLLETHAPSDPCDPANRAACDAVLAHGAALRVRLHGEGLHWPDHKLPGILYQCAGARGAVAAAETFAFDHYEEAKRHLGPIHEVTRNAASGVARSLYAKGDYAAAVPIFEIVLRADELLKGVDDSQTLVSAGWLGSCLRAKGNLVRAEPLYRRVLAGRERRLGPEHPDTLVSADNLGVLLKAKGHLISAEQLHRRASEGLKYALGPEHANTLTSLNNLGSCVGALGDLSAAGTLFSEVLAARERVHGPEHPLTLITADNLAGVLQANGDLSAAAPLYRRTLETFERVLGPAHPDTLISMHNLVRCLRAKGNLASAEAVFRRALDACERELGSEHTNTRAIAAKLAALIAARGSASAPETPKPTQPAWVPGPILFSVSFSQGGLGYTLDVLGGPAQATEPVLGPQTPREGSRSG